MQQVAYQGLKTLLTIQLAYLNVHLRGVDRHKMQMSASYLAQKLSMLAVELLCLCCGKGQLVCQVSLSCLMLGLGLCALVKLRLQLIPQADDLRVLSSELGPEVGEVSLSCHALLLSPLLLILQLSLQDLQQ